MPPDSIFIGYGAKKYLKDEDLLHSALHKAFQKEVQEFYINCAKYMQKKMPMTDKLIKAAAVINPVNRLSAKYEDLELICENFPDLVDDSEMDQLHTEFR
jgi:hypothetical protein